MGSKSEKWGSRTVIELQRDGIISVEDGNHGEYRPRPNEFSTIGTSFIRAADMAGGRVLFESAQKISDIAMQRIRKGIGAGGDVILSHKGTVGKVAYVPLDAQPFVCSPQTTFWRTLDNDKIDRRYLFSFLNSQNFKDQLYSLANETDMAGYVSLTSQRGLRVDLPPIEKQRSIAHILGSLDDKIELNRQMNATLQGMAQALFKSWFVDFDPVIDNALAAGNPIPEAFAARAETRRKALAHETANREVAKQFPAAFQFTEEMGWIPEGWEVKSLDKIAEYKNGLALQKFRPNPGENPLPIVKIAQLRNGEATWDELASPNISPECIIHNGDMIFSWSGSLIIDIWCGGEAALNQHLFKVTSSDFPKWFYLNWSIEHLCNFQKIAADKAVTMGHIKRSHLSDANCAIPDNDLLVKASEIITPYIEKIISQRIQNRKLSKLRDTLLPKLISGEIRIPEAKKITEEAMA